MCELIPWSGGGARRIASMCELIPWSGAAGGGAAATNLVRPLRGSVELWTCVLQRQPRLPSQQLRAVLHSAAGWAP